MKEDKLLNAVLSFLVPVIFIYGFFSLSQLFVGNGFFTLFLSLNFFLCGISLYSLNHSLTKKAIKNHLKILSFIAAIAMTIYLTGLVFTITGSFSI